MSKLKFIKYKLIILLLLFISFRENSLAEQNFITVFCDKQIERVNKKTFGNSIIAYDPTAYEDWTKEYFGYSDYGAGIWDPKWKESVKEVVVLTKASGITVLRFPGGCGTHHYIWQNAIGKDRKHFLFGIDEFLKVCEEVGAEPVITLSYFEGDETDKANLVEYLNSPDDGNHEWAARRSKNGHKEPYGVKYFEVGNEDWHGDHRNINKVSSEEYAKRYLKYYYSMKAIDPVIKIGAILYTPYWNRNVLRLIKDKIDFGIIHTYPSPEVNKEKIEHMNPEDIFKISLAMPTMNDDSILKQTLLLLRQESGKNVPLAITEYNGGFVQEKPVPYRHCLGTALINADLLRIFMRPENNILMANYWNFNNGYTGMIYSKDNFMKHDYRTSIEYYKRPNYYVFEMYAKHFGDELLLSDVKSDTYDVRMYKPFIKSFLKGILTGTVFKDNLLKNGWEIGKLNGVNVSENNDILQIDFQNPTEFNYYHSVKRVEVEPGIYYKISGYIKTENLEDSVGVCLEAQDGRGWLATHSAEMTEAVSGTTDWRYVEAIYDTLLDANSIMVIARRNGNNGPLKGKAYFKGVKCEKFVPDMDSFKVPYLSVNASKSADGKKIYLMVVNKSMDASKSVQINLKGFEPASNGNIWVLNGPSIDATNENKSDNVKVKHHEFEVKGNPFEFTFEPHSLTAIEIERK